MHFLSEPNTILPWVLPDVSHNPATADSACQAVYACRVVVLIRSKWILIFFFHVCDQPHPSNHSGLTLHLLKLPVRLCKLVQNLTHILNIRHTDFTNLCILMNLHRIRCHKKIHELILKLINFHKLVPSCVYSMLFFCLKI